MTFRNFSRVLAFLILASLLGACGEEKTTSTSADASSTTVSIPLFGKGNTTPTAGLPGVTAKAQPGAVATTVMSGKDIYSNLWVDSANIYFVSVAEMGSDGFPVLGLYKVSKTAEKAAPELVMKGVANSNSVSVPLLGDEDNLYFVQNQVDVVKLSKKSGALTTLYKGDLSNTDKAPARLVQDADNLYWLSLYETAVYKLSKKGGAPVILVPAYSGTSQSAGLGRWSLAVDNSGVYYASGVKGTLERVDKNGGAPTQLLKFDKEEMMPVNIVLDNDSIYWIGTFYSPSSKDISVGGILKLAKSGGTPSEVPLKTTDQFETDPIASQTGRSGGDNLMLLGQTFYWPAHTFHTPIKSEIRRVSTDGGVYYDYTVTEQGPNSSLTADDKNLYWVAGDPTFKLDGGQMIMRTPK